MNRVLANELKDHIDKRVAIRGWLHNLRRMGKVNFIIVRDRTGLAQAVAGPNELAPLEGLQMETVLEVSGRAVASPAAPSGVELHDIELRVLSPVTDILPFDLNKPDISTSLPVFLDHATVGHRHLRQRAILGLAGGIVSGFRKTLDAMDFVEVFSPKIVASATESGANVFKIEYFGNEAYLAQSPQFYKQIMVGVFERVYEIAPVFRAEPHATSRHTNEFISLDAEFGFIDDHFTVMELLTEVIKGILANLRANHAQALDYLSVDLPKVNESIPWIYYPEAQELIFEREGIDARGEPDLAPEHERAIGRWAKEVHDSDFVFVPGYPMVKRPFYTHPNPEDPTYSNSFDLLLRGLELVTGGQRLHIYDEHVAALTKAGQPLEPYKTYLECFKYGMPPHGGFAIGLERFIAQILQTDNVKWVTLFPRDQNRLTP